MALPGYGLADFVQLEVVEASFYVQGGEAGVCSRGACYCIVESLDDIGGAVLFSSPGHFVF